MAGMIHLIIDYLEILTLCLKMIITIQPFLQELRVQDNRGMTYIARLKGLLRMIFSRISSSVGRKPRNIR